MKSFMLENESDIQTIRDLVKRLPEKSTIANLGENLQLDSIKSKTRLWKIKGDVVAFAYVDNYSNLRFEILPEYHSIELEDEIIDWGISCVEKSNIEFSENKTLDASFRKENAWQITMLKRAGFVQEDFRSLGYERSLSEPINKNHPFPSNFSLRYVEGKEEVDNLVALHRAAFDTENFTSEARLAIMNAPEYEQELDLVAVAPNGDLAAFCICGMEEENDQLGYTDPIGVHPRYQKLGLGKALVTAGFELLKKKGAKVAELGTSSENIAMQRLAESLGFILVAEKLWFSKEVS